MRDAAAIALWAVIMLAIVAFAIVVPALTR
jgi:hypothetical protein